MRILRILSIWSIVVGGVGLAGIIYVEMAMHGWRSAANVILQEHLVYFLATLVPILGGVIMLRVSRRRERR